MKINNCAAMKTLDKVTACVFAAIGLMVFIAAVVAGAPHQFALAGLCAVLALMMWPWNENNKIN
jgi:hypothetical protein